MSDYRAIAAATATLRSLLQSAIEEQVPGAKVRVGPPSAESHETSGGMINIFLFTVQPNVTWRNEELVYRRPDGSLIRKPQLALDIQLLVSFYGESYTPLLLLGLAMAALHNTPYPPLRYFPGADAGGGFPKLGDGRGSSLPITGSGLEGQHHSLSFVHQPFSHDEMAQLWGLFSQVPYVTSAVYLGSVILLEPDVETQPELPVTRPLVHFQSFDHPWLESVEPQIFVWKTGYRLHLQGRSLSARYLRVKVGELDADVETVEEDRLIVSLPDDILVGTQPVRVLHGIPQDDAEGARWDKVTSPVSVTVIPQVGATLQLPTRAGDDEDSVSLAIGVQPMVRPGSETFVLLNSLGGLPGVGRLLPANLSPTLPNHLIVEGKITPGRYLVRVQVDGVVSRPWLDEDPESPTYREVVGPEMEVR